MISKTAMDVDTPNIENKEDVPSDNDAIIKTEENKDGMNSGFAKHIEKEKVIEVFHTVAWPALFSAGWTKVGW
jgi:hypothetical protein